MQCEGEKAAQSSKNECLNMKNLTFAFRPIKPGDSEDEVWKECVKAKCSIHG